MGFFLQLLANGIVLGTFYALSALGLTLVFGLMRVVNFAHGELYVVGGLIGWALTAVLGLNFFLALAIVVIVLGIAGYLIDWFLIAWVRGEGEEPTILLTIGLSIFIANTALLIVGTAPQTVLSPFLSKPLFLGPVVITQSSAPISSSRRQRSAARCAPHSKIRWPRSLLASAPPIFTASRSRSARHSPAPPACCSAPSMSCRRRLAA
jgi:branched-subunit amino acid ABC-type transport system permease component